MMVALMMGFLLSKKRHERASFPHTPSSLSSRKATARRRPLISQEEHSNLPAP